MPQVAGLPASSAKSRLQSAGFKVAEVEVDSSRPQGTVVTTVPSGSAMPGSTITISVSNGRQRTSRNRGTTSTTTTVNVPGVGPVEIELPGG